MKSQSVNGVLVDSDGSLTTITLNRPEAMNAFDASLAAGVADAVAAAAADAACRAIVLTGAGRGFCAGADLTYLEEVMTARDRDRARALVSNGARIVQAIVGASQPVIAAVNGPAAGGGASLALACDIRIASTDASIGTVFNRIGLHPDLGATYFLPHLVGFGRAMELVLSGGMIDAAEAHRIGLFNRLVPPDALMTEARAVARQLAARAPLAVSRTKRSMYRMSGPPLEEVLAAELEQQLALFETDDAREGLLAFLEKRSPLFRGS
jgi:2-(1,2-epoxy-1,2-dihydrophenyl)acetyl-CoA isomerase